MGLEEQDRHAEARSQAHKREQIVLSLRGLVTLRGAITQDDLAGFFVRARTLVSGWRLGVIFCDVGAVDRADVAILDGIARIRLFVRRHGKEMQVRSPNEDFTQLLDFTGFRTCLPVSGSSGRTESSGQAGSSAQALPSGQAESNL